MTDRSSVASRNIGAVTTLLGAGDSLENVGTAILDDGCFAYVESELKHYELHKFDTSPPNPPLIIKPICNIGRWVPAGGGAQGNQGPQGRQGAQGAQGFQGGGFQGSQGGTGTQGAQGNQGAQGFQGQAVTGAQGSTGPQGPSGGAQGAQGATGVQGFQGAQGFQGSGFQGAQGATGSQGSGGGAQGAQGNQGATGTTGAQGNQGSQGFQGSQGAQGATGTTGAQGNQGAQGFQGAAGTQGFQGATGAGTQGFQGATGTQGSQGSQGGQGTQGFQGQAVTGSQGATGPQGPSGGAQGSQGFQGAQGNQGAQGTQGAGFQGAQGSAGAQGSSGGAQGAQGAQGGTAQINPASIAALQAVDTTGLTSGTLADTATVGDLYRLNKSPTAGETAGIDATQVVAATTVAGNVWERLGLVNLANAFVAGWFVDDATGNDTNNGTSSITALKTTEELCRRLSPGGQTYVVRQNTTITIGAGSYGEIAFNVSFPSGTAFSLTINGAVTSSAPITLATVVDTVPTATPVRGRITTASGTFVDKKRIRSTSGASVGAVTYSTGITSATDTFVKSWFLESGLTAVNIAAGTTCVVDTLTTTIARVQIRTNGNPIGGTLTISDIILANGCDIEDFIVGSAAMKLSQCEIGGGSGSCRVNGNIQLRNCRSTASLLSAFQLIQPVFFGCVVQGQFITETSVLFAHANCFNGGTLHLGGVVSTSGATTRLNDVEWVNGIASSAVSLAAGTTLEVAGQQFGFGAAYSIGFQLDSGCTATTTAVSLLGILATQELSLTGHNLNYSDVPASTFFPRAACVFGINPDPTATSGSQGFQGAQGTQGAQGFQGSGGGAQGAQGPTGTQGFQGQNGGGAQGSQGRQGGQGFQGATGVQGFQGGGFQGAQGFQGAAGTGSQGAQGFQGATGTQGFQGAAGTGSQGAQGATGAQGFQGAIGTQGNQGAQGTQGAGFQGAQGGIGAQGAGGGAQGAQGATGVQGFQGAQGFQGGGFQGAQGAQAGIGAQGFQGATGTGSQGAQGATGTTGAQGNQGAQGGGFQGAQGFQGATGTQGFQGATGATGGTGTTGAQGAQGFQGAQGRQGNTGSTGTTGSQGAQGGAGNTGATGAQGATGATGPQGFQGGLGAGGAQGSQGRQGGQGFQGATGVQGFQGSGFQGAQGFQGARGFQGFQGATGTQGFQGSTTVGPLTQVFYVDAANVGAATGSIQQPYATPTAALAAHTTGSVTLLVAPGNYGGWTINTARDVTLIGLCGPTDQTIALSFVNLTFTTTPGFNLTLQNCTTNSITDASSVQSNIQLIDVQAGIIQGSGSGASNTVLRMSSVLPSARLDGMSTAEISLVSQAFGEYVFVNATFSNSQASAGEATPHTFNYCVFVDTVTAGPLLCDGCSFRQGITAPAGAATISRLNNCTIDLDITAATGTNQIFLSGCKVGTGATLSHSISGAWAVFNCRNTSFGPKSSGRVNLAGSSMGIQLDAMSERSLFSSGNGQASVTATLTPLVSLDQTEPNAQQLLDSATTYTFNTADRLYLAIPTLTADRIIQLSLTGAAALDLLPIDVYGTNGHTLTVQFASVTLRAILSTDVPARYFFQASEDLLSITYVGAQNLS
jgi:hypothetical protein